MAVATKLQSAPTAVKRTSVRIYITIVVLAALLNIILWVKIASGRWAPPSPPPTRGPKPLTSRPMTTVAVPIEAKPLATGEDVGMRLLRNYNASRSNRACTPLPSNVTIALEDDFEPGFSLEVRMSDERQEELRKQYPPNAGATAAAKGKAAWAYVLIVSNHKYVDGALVMGDSLRELSTRVRNGECDLVIIVTDSIVADSLRQLALVFNKVKVARSLGRFATKSAYKATFDKAYLFFLLDYERVMFLDADHLVYKGAGIDGLWTKRPLNAPNELMAVGDSEYFQTALMVVQPNRDVFIDIYLEFRYGTFGYNQWRARDGILLRNCLLQSVQGIGHPSGLFHFYGFTKPWFNKDKKPKRRSEHYMLTYDHHYRDWWARYEALHESAFKKMKLSTPYGVDAWMEPSVKQWLRHYGYPVSAEHLMWIQRHSKGSEFFRPVSAVKAQLNNLRLPSLQAVVGKAGESCDTTCGGSKLVCRADGLLFSSINNQTVLTGLSAVYGGSGGGGGGAVPVSKAGKKKKATPSPTPPPPPGACEVVDSVAWAPAVGADGRCVVSAGDDPLDRPLCNATARDGLLRVCACVGEEHRFDEAAPNW